MTKFNFFLKFNVFLFLSIIFFSIDVVSQGVYNSAAINARDGVYIYVDGSVQNEAGEMLINEDSGISSQIFIKQDFLNNSVAGGSGYYRLIGDWFNNNIFNAGSGSVFFEGDNQILSGNESTYFYNLILDGTGLKTQTIDQFVLNTLDLKHLELRTENFSMFIENTDVNAISLTDGFVSSLGTGFLSRNTNTSQMYLFPVGSTLGVDRYRPVEITPANTTANTYTVRMANEDATNEGFDRNLVESLICETNPLFYHRINRTEGESSIDLKIYYDESEDGEWEGIANWTVFPDEWQIVSGSSSTSDIPLSYAHVNDWNTFNETPYILYNSNPEPVITSSEDPMCEGDNRILTADPPGGTFSVISGPGNIDDNTLYANEGGDITIQYEIIVEGCTGSVTQTITVNSNPNVIASNSGPVCVGESFELNETGGEAVSWLWESDGDAVITDADSQNPTVTNAVDGEVFTLTITDINNCKNTDQTTVIINEFSIAPEEITGNNEICANEETELTVVGGSLGTGAIWQWYSGDCGEVYEGSGTSIIVSPENTTSYYVRAEGDCNITECAEITVFTDGVLPVFEDIGPYCLGDSPDLLPSTSINGITGYWEPETINTSIEGTTTYIFTPDDESGCAAPLHLDVIISNPIANVQEYPPLCHGEIGQVVVNATGGIAPYTGTGNFNLLEGSHDIIVTDSNGCADTVTVMFLYPDALIGSFISEEPSCYGNDDGYIDVSIYGGTEPYTFKANEINSDYNYISGLTAGTYKVYVYDANDCELYLGEANLKDDPFNDCISIPNTFTPNGDGINDEWIIENIEMFKDAAVTVFNRWGHKIYEAKGNIKPWDGTYKGRKLPVGSYMYVINLHHTNTDRDKYLGIITIMY